MIDKVEDQVVIYTLDTTLTKFRSLDNCRVEIDPNQSYKFDGDLVIVVQSRDGTSVFSFNKVIQNGSES